MKIDLIKTAGGAIVASLPEDAEKLTRFKAGDVIRADVVKPRNGKFHRKFMALINVGFEAWDDPATEYKGETIHKNLDKFRRDITIMAGFHTSTVNLRGEVRFEAKSISFASMDEDEFENLYSRVIDVLLGKVLKNYTRKDLDYQVQQILRFS